MSHFGMILRVGTSADTLLQRDVLSQRHESSYSVFSADLLGPGNRRCPPLLSVGHVRGGFMVSSVQGRVSEL